MSHEATRWVREHAPVKAGRNWAVLMVLADYVRNNGTTAWPSAARIAEETRYDVRGVRRALSELEESGVIYRSTHPDVDRLPVGRRPTVWALDLTLSRHESEGVANRPPVVNTPPVADGPPVVNRPAEGWPIDPQGVVNTPPNKEITGIEQGERAPDMATKHASPLADSLYESFPDHCKKHRHIPPTETGPCGGCQAQREANQRLADQSKDDQIALESHRIAGIADCDYCTDDGKHPYIKRSTTGGLFEHFKKCNHSDQDRQELDEVLAFRERHGDAA